MTRNIFTNFKEIPETAGIFSLSDKNNRSLFVGVAENIRVEVKRNLLNHKTLKTETANVEIIDSGELDLINRLAKTLHLNSPIYNLSLSEQNIYPHLKLTNEKFPR